MPNSEIIPVDLYRATQKQFKANFRHLALDNLRCPFKVCKRTFGTKYSLLRHFHTHNPERPYKCQFCSKAFSLPNYLKDHVNIHTGERPYKCSYPGCEKTFMQSGKLSIHQKSHGPYSKLMGWISKVKKEYGQINRTHGWQKQICKVDVNFDLSPCFGQEQKENLLISKMLGQSGQPDSQVSAAGALSRGHIGCQTSLLNPGEDPMEAQKKSYQEEGSPRRSEGSSESALLRGEMRSSPPTCVIQLANPRYQAASSSHFHANQCIKTGRSAGADLLGKRKRPGYQCRFTESQHEAIVILEPVQKKRKLSTELATVASLFSPALISPEGDLLLPWKSQASGPYASQREYPIVQKATQDTTSPEAAGTQQNYAQSVLRDIKGCKRASCPSDSKGHGGPSPLVSAWGGSTRRSSAAGTIDDQALVNYFWPHASRFSPRQ